jgi:uncharacterized protein (TIGR03437 family)
MSGLPAAGSIGALFGTALAAATLSAASLPLPTTLGSTTVRLNGVAAPLFYVSPTQINFQVPWELAGQSQVSVSVTTGTTSSPPVSLSLPAFSPGIFTMNSSGAGQGAVVIAGTSSIAAPEGALPAAHPVDRGDYIAIYCTGLGLVTNRPDSGASGGSDPLALTITSPTVAIGGLPTPVLYAGLAPGFVGLYQVNVQVPDQLAPGARVPVVLTIAGNVSNTVFVAVR